MRGQGDIEVHPDVTGATGHLLHFCHHGGISTLGVCLQGRYLVLRRQGVEGRSLHDAGELIAKAVHGGLPGLCFPCRVLRMGGRGGRTFYELLVSIRDYRGDQSLRAGSGGFYSLPQLRVDCVLLLLLAEGVSGKAACQRLCAGRQRVEARPTVSFMACCACCCCCCCWARTMGEAVGTEDEAVLTFLSLPILFIIFPGASTERNEVDRTLPWLEADGVRSREACPRVAIGPMSSVGMLNSGSTSSNSLSCWKRLYRSKFSLWLPSVTAWSLTALITSELA